MLIPETLLLPYRGKIIVEVNGCQQQAFFQISYFVFNTTSIRWLNDDSFYFWGNYPLLREYWRPLQYRHCNCMCLCGVSSVPNYILCINCHLNQSGMKKTRTNFSLCWPSRWETRNIISPKTERAMQKCYRSAWGRQNDMHFKAAC